MPARISNVFWARFYWLLDNNGYDLKPAWQQAKAHMKQTLNLTKDEADQYSKQLWEEFIEWC